MSITTPSWPDSMNWQPVSAPDQHERRLGAATEALARSDRLNRWLRITGLVLAVYVAFIVTAASIVGVVNSIQSATFAKAALVQAKENGDIVAFLEKCLTPGPTAPNAERTGTGHECYDKLEGNRAAAVRRIIEALRGPGA